MTAALLGVDPATLPELEPDPDPPAERYADSVPDKQSRVRAASPEWVEDYWYEGWTWKQEGHRVPVDVLKLAFSFGELARIWAGSGVISRLSDWFEEEHPLLEKVRHSLHHYEARDGIYDHLAAGVAGLRRLAWPGAEVRLAYVSKYRVDGPAENLPAGERVWIDNDIGALVYVGGRHVLTLGLGFGAGAVYLSQVQLRQKKGNRWLYKLPAHYLDVALEVLSRAFAGYELWLVDGESAVMAVVRSYGRNASGVTPEGAKRIAALYDRPLAAFSRFEPLEEYWGRSYRRLAPKRKDPS